MLGLNIVERLRLIGKQVKSHICRDFKTMEEDINLALHTRVIIERIAVEVAELKDVPLETEPLRDITMLALTRIVPRKVTRF